LLLLEKIPLLLILLQWILLMLERTLLFLEGIPISRGIVLSWVEPGFSLPDSDEGLERVLVGMLWWHWGFRSMTMTRHWDSSVIVWRSGALTVHIVRIKVWRLVLLLVWLSLERIPLLLVRVLLLIMLVIRILLLLERILSLLMLLERILLLPERVIFWPTLTMQFFLNSLLLAFDFLLAIFGSFWSSR
jgi:hypothetical protein